MAVMPATSRLERAFTPWGCSVSSPPGGKKKRARNTGVGPGKRVKVPFRDNVPDSGFWHVATCLIDRLSREA
jgi:hypothetical protein